MVLRAVSWAGIVISCPLPTLLEEATRSQLLSPTRPAQVKAGRSSGFLSGPGALEKAGSPQEQMTILLMGHPGETTWCQGLDKGWHHAR